MDIWICVPNMFGSPWHHGGRPCFRSLAPTLELRVSWTSKSGNECHGVTRMAALNMSVYIYIYTCYHSHRYTHDISQYNIGKTCENKLTMITDYNL